MAIGTVHTCTIEVSFELTTVGTQARHSSEVPRSDICKSGAA